MNMDTKRPANPISLNGAFICSPVIPVGRGGVKDLTVKIAISCRNRIKNAAERIAQGYPADLISRFIMIGKIMPPIEEPVAMIPNAMPRFVVNHVEIELIAKVQDKQILARIPRVIMTVSPLLTRLENRCNTNCTTDALC